LLLHPAVTFGTTAEQLQLSHQLDSRVETASQSLLEEHRGCTPGCFPGQLAQAAQFG